MSVKVHLRRFWEGKPISDYFTNRLSSFAVMECTFQGTRRRHSGTCPMIFKTRIGLYHAQRWRDVFGWLEYSTYASASSKWIRLKFTACYTVLEQVYWSAVHHQNLSHYYNRMNEWEQLKIESRTIRLGFYKNERINVFLINSSLNSWISDLAIQGATVRRHMKALQTAGQN